VVGREVMFFELTYYMLPLGAAMVLLIWVLCMVLFKPERPTVPGLKGRARMLYDRLGPMTSAEILSLAIVAAVVAALGLRSFFPVLERIDQAAIVLVATVLFFIGRVLTIKELEQMPWNIVLLFGGAMSIGLCLWETGAARWLAVRLLPLCANADAVVFVMCLAVFVLAVTNFIVNVAVIAISLPVALIVARYLVLAPEIVFFSVLAAAGMPFLLPLGAAPNAIAFESRQFSARSFFLTGIPASIILIGVLALFVWLIWPLMGMPLASQRCQH
jgi:solute carrier family 13 (sodium-dependent dicarboxylate transporter), member 2/3/5